MRLYKVSIQTIHRELCSPVTRYVVVSKFNEIEGAISLETNQSILLVEDMGSYVFLSQILIEEEYKKIAEQHRIAMAKCGESCD